MNAKINTRLFSTAFFEANNGTAYHKALAQFEKPLLQEVMTECRGNQTKAAEMLGLNRGTFRKKLIQHGLHK